MKGQDNSQDVVGGPSNYPTHKLKQQLSFITNSDEDEDEVDRDAGELGDDEEANLQQEQFSNQGEFRRVDPSGYSPLTTDFVFDVNQQQNPYQQLNMSHSHHHDSGRVVGHDSGKDMIFRNM